VYRVILPFRIIGNSIRTEDVIYVEKLLKNWTLRPVPRGRKTQHHAWRQNHQFIPCSSL